MMHYFPMLPFVCGLGFRKARALRDALRASGSLISRKDLIDRELLPAKVGPYMQDPFLLPMGSCDAGSHHACWPLVVVIVPADWCTYGERARRVRTSHTCPLPVHSLQVYENAAGFLRIRPGRAEDGEVDLSLDGLNILDNTRIHPECYVTYDM